MSFLCRSPIAGGNLVFLVAMMFLLYPANAGWAWEQQIKRELSVEEKWCRERQDRIIGRFFMAMLHRKPKWVEDKYRNCFKDMTKQWFRSGYWSTLSDLSELGDAINEKRLATSLKASAKNLKDNDPESTQSAAISLFFYAFDQDGRTDWMQTAQELFVNDIHPDLKPWIKKVSTTTMLLGDSKKRIDFLIELKDITDKMSKKVRGNWKQLGKKSV